MHDNIQQLLDFYKEVLHLGFLNIKKKCCDLFASLFATDALKGFPKIRKSLKSSQNRYFSSPVSSSPSISPRTAQLLSALSIFSLYPMALYLSWNESRLFVWHNLSSWQEAIMCVRPTQRTFPRNSPEALMHTGQSSLGAVLLLGLYWTQVVCSSLISATMQTLICRRRGSGPAGESFCHFLLFLSLPQADFGMVISLIYRSGSSAAWCVIKCGQRLIHLVNEI